MPTAPSLSNSTGPEYGVDTGAARRAPMLAMMALVAASSSASVGRSAVVWP
jgi:hypothetical protein